MANIRVDSPIAIFDGQALTFKSPADCSAVTGLKVNYHDGAQAASKVFQFADAHGNNVGGKNLFAANVLVKVVLDTQLNRAYVQNADTNAYLEGRFDRIHEELDSGEQVMFYGSEAGRYKISTYPVDIMEAGPYWRDPATVVCDTTSDNYAIYKAIATSTVSYHAGRYSYGFHNKYYAYKIDHVTRTATLLCDLSSYVGTTSGKSLDRILAVDDKYVYFVKHLACPTASTRDDSIGYDECYGTLYKFNHEGTLITSKNSAKTNADSWAQNLKAGFSASSESYCSIFYNSSSVYKQTKNYIVWRSTGTAQSSSGSRNYFFYAISKTGLCVVSGSYMFYWSGTSARPFEVMYEKDVLLIKDGEDAEHSVYKLTDTTPSSSSGYIITSNNIANKLTASYNYYLSSITAFHDHSSGVCYYKLTLWLRSYSSDEYGVYYTVVTDDDFDIATGKFTIKYVTTTSMAFGQEYYDPVTKEWVKKGYPYQVYPAYVPAEKSPTMISGFTAAPFFRVNGYYYFIRTEDSIMYKAEDKIVYAIDRLEAVE